MTNRDADSPQPDASGPPPPSSPEYTLWTLMQGARQAEARVRLSSPAGLELRILVDGDVVAAQVYGSSAQLSRETEVRRADFERRGWRPENPDAPAAVAGPPSIHVAVAQRAGVPVSEVLDLTHGRVSAQIAMRIGGVGASDLTAFIGGETTMRMALRLGISLPGAGNGLVQLVGRDGAIGIILGLLLGRSS